MGIWDVVKTSNSARTVLLLILLLGTLKFTHLQNNILSYDYFGFYLYLPAIFIYHDPGLSDLSWLEQVNEQYNNTPMFYQLERVGDNFIIRFFSGIAMLLSPFFFAGHMAAYLTPYPEDGFSIPYQLAMTAAAFFYIMIGLILLRKVLLTFFSETVTSVTLIALYLGTNFFLWTTFDAGAPHTILFTLYASLLWLTIRWHNRPNMLTAAAIGLVIGLIIVSRPSEIICILIPLLWNVYDRRSLVNKINLLAQHYPHLIALACFTILAGLPQMIYFKTFTGRFYFSTYNDPLSVMDWGNPRFLYTLFSFRKGWFVYAPLMTFAVAGLTLLPFKARQVALPLILHFLINLYFLASFTSLISYGYRAFIQSYALLAIPLGYVITVVFFRWSVMKIFGSILLTVFISLSVFQGWQTMMGIIHGSRMTKDYYLDIFGKTSITSDDLKLLRLDPYADDQGYQFDDTTGYQLCFQEFHDFTRPFGEFNQVQITHPEDSTKTLFRLDDALPYSPGIKLPYHAITSKEHFWSKISGRVFSPEDAPAEALRLVVAFNYQGSKKKLRGTYYKYRSFIIEPGGYNTGQWYSFQTDYLSPEVTSPNDRFETYLWSVSGDTFLIESFEVRIYEPVEGEK